MNKSSTKNHGNVRAAKKHGYTVVPNGVLPEGKKISARAWGLYVYLLSRPDGWKTHAKQLSSVFSEGVGAIYTALQNLVDAGLMVKVEYYEGGLKRQRYEQVSPEEILKSPDTDFRDLGNRDLENRRVTTTDITTTEFTQDSFTSEQSSEQSVSPSLSKRRKNDASKQNFKAENADPISPTFYHSNDRQILLQNIQSIAKAQVDHGIGSQPSEDMIDALQVNLETAFGSESIDELDGMIHDYAWIPKRTHVEKKRAAIWLNQLLNEWSDLSGGLQWRGEHVVYEE